MFASDRPRRVKYHDTVTGKKCIGSISVFLRLHIPKKISPKLS